MSDLVEFLRARFAEDERVALAVSTGPNVPEKWTASQYREGVRPWRIDGQCSLVVEAVCGPDATHMVRHDPARILAEVKAKREVVRLAARAHDYQETFMSGFAAAMEEALRLFALPYADHPDYEPDWAPSV